MNDLVRHLIGGEGGVSLIWTNQIAYWNETNASLVPNQVHRVGLTFHHNFVGSTPRRVSDISILFLLFWIRYSLNIFWRKVWIFKLNSRLRTQAKDFKEKTKENFWFDHGSLLGFTWRVATRNAGISWGRRDDDSTTARELAPADQHENERSWSRYGNTFKI